MTLFLFLLLRAAVWKWCVCARDAGTLNFHLSIKTEKSQKVWDFLKREKRKSLLKVKNLS